jgi:hypothetical protein
MQELAGRLTALDPDATESLRVIAYFDALVAGGAGMESLVRAAAVLSGVPAGLERESVLRVTPDGIRAEPRPREGWPHAHTAGGPIVWIERAGPPHANDAMILERFALSAAIVTATSHASAAGALEALIDPERSSAERSRFAERLRLDTRRGVRVVALPATADEPYDGPTAMILTARGAARLVVLPSGHPVTAGPAGVADVTVADVPRGWEDALTALRLASGDEVVHAGEFGVLSLLWRDPRAAAHPDVAALAALDARSLQILDALCETESIRAASLRLGMHHSSVQERQAHLHARLGFDPRSSLGRARYRAARMLMRLAVEEAT